MLYFLTGLIGGILALCAVRSTLLSRFNWVNHLMMGERGVRNSYWLWVVLLAFIGVALVAADPERSKITMEGRVAAVGFLFGLVVHSIGLLAYLHPDAVRDLFEGFQDRAKEKKRKAAAEKQKKSDPPALTDKESLGIFISYRRADSQDAVGRLYDRLQEAFEQAGLWKDVDSIPGGVDFRVYIERAIEKVDVVLVVIGREFLASDRLKNATDPVGVEIEKALALDKPIFPIFLNGASMPEAETLPEEIRELTYRNGISLRVDPDFNRDCAKLIETLKARPWEDA